MSILERLRRIFSSSGGEEEAAEREEYGLDGRGRDDLGAAGGPGYAGMETQELAEDELDELKPPADENP
jgi:hypothetical protein